MLSSVEDLAGVAVIDVYLMHVTAMLSHHTSGCLDAVAHQLHLNFISNRYISYYNFCGCFLI